MFMRSILFSSLTRSKIDVNLQTSTGSELRQKLATRMAELEQLNANSGRLSANHFKRRQNG